MIEREGKKYILLKIHMLQMERRMGQEMQLPEHLLLHLGLSPRSCFHCFLLFEKSLEVEPAGFCHSRKKTQVCEEELPEMNR